MREGFAASFEPRAGYRPDEVDGVLDRLFGLGVRPLQMEDAVLEAVLAGWRAQQRSRGNKRDTIEAGVRLVRRMRDQVQSWPWRWRALEVEEFVCDLASEPRPCRPSTLRSYQSRIRSFLDYLTDGRYPWTVVCERQFGCRPAQPFDERNLIVHVDDWEADPARRALTVDELQAFFDFCDEQVRGRRALRRKGSLAALRDSAMFKVCYGWGLRRAELVGLDVADFHRNPRLPRFGEFGTLRVRLGKAARGGNLRPRNVLSVFDWSVEVVEQYVREIRPLFGFDAHPALWVTERGGRVSRRHVDERFAEYRDALGLAPECTPHALRHSYVTHLHEDGFDPVFIKEQVGHRFMSTTALYTAVSTDFKHRTLEAAINAQLRALVDQDLPA
jgi:integrase/recombinase XerC